MNLIDTPGHVDFSYEVSRSLAACEGALLLIDASQGVEAQTLSNLFMALDHDLRILIVLNKIDLASARVDEVRASICAITGESEDKVLLASAREGIGVKEILEAVVREVPPPKGKPEAPLRALIFDSTFDSYRGVCVYVRVIEGTIGTGDRIQLVSTGKQYEVLEVGIFQLRMVPQDKLEAGDVGYIVAGIKIVADAKVGDTVASVGSDVEALPGYKPMKPMVYSGLFPIDSDDYLKLKDALGKFQLNDASLIYEPETSLALGFGFRAGFLGPLHMEIVVERLRREYDLDLIATTPTVPYFVYRLDWDEGRGGQPRTAAPHQRGREARGTVRPGNRHHAHGLRGWGHEALPGQAGRVPGNGVPRPDEGASDLPDPALGTDLRLLRPTQVLQPGIRNPGL